MDYAIVIPAYNEQATIRDIVQRAQEYCQHVIVVDDGSSDNTCDQLQDSGVILLRNETNSGKAASLWRGMQHAQTLKVDAVITLDGDGQHKPEDIPRFLEAYQQYPDTIIIGARLADKSVIPAKRYYANKFANFWLSWAAGYLVEDSQSGFRLYPMKLIDNLKIHIDRSKSFVFESEILIKAAQLGIKSQPIKIAAVYGTQARSSHFRGVTDIVLITRMVAWSLISRGLYLPGLFKLLVSMLPQRHRKVRQRKIRHSKAVGLDGIAMLLLSIIIIILTGGLSYLWSLYRVTRTAITCPAYYTEGDYLLVLGMQLKHNAINKLYHHRLAKAAELLATHPEATVIILGGLTGTSTISEADAGRQFLVAQGIQEQRILLEKDSRHTLDNLKRARQILQDNQYQQAILITNRYHLYRAHLQAKGFKIHHQLCAAESTFRFRVFNLLRLIKEAFHVHWYISGKIYSHATKNKHMLDRIR